MNPAVVHYYNRVPKREGLHTAQESSDKFDEASCVERAFKDVAINHPVHQGKSWKNRISRGELD